MERERGAHFTLELLQNPVHSTGAAAAAHDNVKVVLVLLSGGDVGSGGGSNVGHFLFCFSVRSTMRGIRGVGEIIGVLGVGVARYVFFWL